MADTGGTSVLDWAGMAGGILTLGGGLVKCIKWLVGRNDGHLARCEKKIEEFEGKFDAFTKGHVVAVRQIDCLVNVCIILIDDVASNNPGSRSIGQAKALIGSEFPDLFRRTFRTPAGTPPDMATLLHEIDARTADAKREAAGLAPHKAWKEQP